jgi:hypothetical protein
MSGPCNPYKLVSAATTNATYVPCALGLATMLQAINNGTGWAYLKIYDKGASPTVGTDTSILCIGLPPGGGSIDAFSFTICKGLAFAITGAPADSDTTAVAAAQCVVNFLTN